MIEIRDVVKTFDGFRALDGVTMTVPRARCTVWSGQTARENPRSSAT